MGSYDELKETTNGEYDELKETTNGEYDELKETTNREYGELKETTNGEYDELKETTNGELRRIEMGGHGTGGFRTQPEQSACQQCWLAVPAQPSLPAESVQFHNTLADQW